MEKLLNSASGISGAGQPISVALLNSLSFFSIQSLEVTCMHPHILPDSFHHLGDLCSMSIQNHFNKFNKKIYLTSHSEGYKRQRKR